MMKIIGFCTVCLTVLLVSGCGSHTPRDTDGLVDIIPTSEKDRAPKKPKDAKKLDSIPDAVPRVDARTKAGNKNPYKVKGIVYRLMDSPKGYKEKGIASWYGLKFHGNTTSNGEIYDIYGMTAAHKTLPIPSYVRVTNLDNKRSVVVRVNDRGPFAHGRIIDLSYAAAHKLDYLNKGTASVEVEYIDPTTYNAKTNIPSSTGSGSGSAPAVASPVTNPSSNTATAKDVDKKIGQLFLQVGAFQDRISAFVLQRKVSVLTSHPVNVFDGKTLDDRDIFRVQVGPLPSEHTLNTLLQRFSDNGVSPTIRVIK